MDRFIKILGTDKADPVIINQAPPPLQARILKNKMVLADDELFLRHKYESLALRKYFDT